MNDTTILYTATPEDLILRVKTGDGEAAMQMGLICLAGFGIRQNLSQASTYFAKAKQLGVINADVFIAYIHECNDRMIKAIETYVGKENSNKKDNSVAKRIDSHLKAVCSERKKLPKILNDYGLPECPLYTSLNNLLEDFDSGRRSLTDISSIISLSDTDEQWCYDTAWLQFEEGNDGLASMWLKKSHPDTEDELSKLLQNKSKERTVFDAEAIEIKGNSLLDKRLKIKILPDTIFTSGDALKKALLEWSRECNLRKQSYLEEQNRLEEERQRKIEEERRKAEEEKKRKEEEARRKAEEEKRRAEAKRQEALRLEREKVEAEKQRIVEEKAREDAEAKRKEALRKEQERAEAEKKRIAEKEAQNKKTMKWAIAAIAAVVAIIAISNQPSYPNYNYSSGGPDEMNAAELLGYKGTENGHEWVNLGLSVKWATCNVGASSPNEYGDYFAWGETSTKSDYSEDNYNWNASSDVARVKWGGNWRMPNKEQFEELISRCTWTWTTLNGTNGYSVTGPNGNSIFLPAAGYRSGSNFFLAGAGGDYWSSSPYTHNSKFAWSLLFGTEEHDTLNVGRYEGHSVRPVIK